MIILIAGTGIGLAAEEILTMTTAIKHECKAVVVVDDFTRISEEESIQKLIENQVLELRAIERDLFEYCDTDYLQEDFGISYNKNLSLETVIPSNVITTLINPNCPIRGTPK
jgi:hypothetical protein